MRAFGHSDGTVNIPARIPGRNNTGGKIDPELTAAYDAFIAANTKEEQLTAIQRV